MSSITRLSDFLSGTPEETPEDGPDQPQNSRPAWNPTPDVPHCRCGAEVDPDVARVFGDNSGDVAVCSACYRSRCGRVYHTDSSALLHFFGGEI